jgi:small subunit ribosomal protein S1
MSNSETPPSNSTPTVADAPATLPDPAASPGPAEPMSNGHAEAGARERAAMGPAEGSPGEMEATAETSPAAGAGGAIEAGGAAEGASEGSDDGSNEGEDDASREGPSEGSAQAAQGEKKRRRRRRRKKPGAQAAGTEEGVAEGAVGDPANGAAEQGALGGDAPDAHTPEPHAPDHRPKKKERRPGPPRERPPVNAGDIVFGKILEITEEAIVIDIPGKAHAIFDRREMLLPEDDESTRPGHAPAAPPAASLPVETAEADAPEAGQAAVAGETQAQDVEAPVTPPVQAAAEVAPRTITEQEPPPDPKVPRVILEVGADFIGVVHSDGGRGGLVVLTHHPHRAERAKPVVEKAFADKTLIEGLVTGVIRGGIEVDVDGLRAFAPGSHVDLRLGADLSHLVAERLPFLVTQYAKRGRDVVLSRRSILEDEARRSRSEALARLKVGDDLDGIVRSVVPFGAFVDIGGIEGLVPLQEMSHDRADGPSDVFKAGEPTRVKVIKIDDKGKVWLSRKATIADPWQQVAQKYATGTRHSAKVVRLQPFGAFVELESGVDGLIHTQDLSIKRIETPDEVVKVGDPIEVVVAHVDASQHKIALHPAPVGDAVNEATQRVMPHKPVKAKVVTIETGGLVVRILGVTGRNARGYVSASATGTPRGTELRKTFTIGQEVEAKVIEMDPRRGEVKLSIRALSEDQERSAYQQYRQQLKAEARFTFGDLLAKKGTPSK